MNKLVVIALLAIFAACVAIIPARGGFKFPSRLPRDWLKRYTADDEDDEEADFWMALAPLAINLVKNKLMKKRDAVEEDEESDNWLLDRIRRQFGVDPSQRVYNYDAAEEDEEEEEADAEFLKNLFKGLGKTALNVGKAYVGQRFGVQLDEEEDEEEADAEFFGRLKDWWNSKGKDLAIKGLQIYSSIKNGGNQAQADEEELSEIKIGKFLGKLGKGALEIGKKYVSSKYGIPLSEDASFDEEADAEFLKKIAKWWNEKGKDLAIKGLQIYSNIKNGGAPQQGDDEEDEESSDHLRFSGALKRLERAHDLLKGLKNSEQSDAEFLDALKNAISKVKDWLKSKFAPKKAEEPAPAPAAAA